MSNLSAVTTDDGIRRSIVNTTEFPEKLTFDDILLVPQHSNIENKREEIKTTSLLGDLVKLDVPIISAAMDTVTELPMMQFMQSAGGLGIHHRYVNSDYTRLLEASHYGPIAVSPSMVDSTDFFPKLAAHAHGQYTPILKVDVAHGDTKYVYEFTKYLKSFDFVVWSGNVVDLFAVYDYSRILDPATDAITVGIGPGSACTTRVVAGIGYPQASAIYEIAQATKVKNFALLADGGIKNSADAVKALALGADAIIIGGLLAGTDQTPGSTEIIAGKEVKAFRGMASKEALGDNGKTIREEGVSGTVPYKGDAQNVIDQLVSGIRTGMGYVGARTIKELQQRTSFIRITEAGRYEGQARI
jgi:IMP dehydrogenase